jgi:hypothetical protein
VFTESRKLDLFQDKRREKKQNYPYDLSRVCVRDRGRHRVQPKARPAGSRPTASGYVKNTVTESGNNYNYVFTFTDHLGNVRLTYGLNAENVLTMMEEENG